jgi:hypothetical protein
MGEGIRMTRFEPNNASDSIGREKTFSVSYRMREGRSEGKNIFALQSVFLI